MLIIKNFASNLNLNSCFQIWFIGYTSSDIWFLILTRSTLWAIGDISYMMMAKHGYSLKKKKNSSYTYSTYLNSSHFMLHSLVTTNVRHWTFYDTLNLRNLSQIDNRLRFVLKQWTGALVWIPSARSAGPNKTTTWGSEAVAAVNN